MYRVQIYVNSIAPPPKKKKKVDKNPDVDTSFLPDQEREEREREERLRLKREWLEQQEQIKSKNNRTFHFQPTHY